MRDYKILVPTIKIDDDVSGIYFLQSNDAYIKIGMSCDIKKRVQAYVTGAIVPIRLVGYIPTEQYELNEQFQHKIWRIFNVKGEWYAPCKPLLRYLSSFFKGIGIPVEEMRREVKNYKELILYCEDNITAVDYISY